MALEYSGRFTTSPDIISQEYMGETMILNVKTDAYVRMHYPVGQFWQLLERHTEVETAFAHLREKKLVPEERAELFFNKCFGDFKRAGLLTLDSATGQRVEPS